MEEPTKQTTKTDLWIWGVGIGTAIWLLLTIAYPLLLHGELGACYFGDARLGETGDFLTGWLTPLAFLWFVVAVFLQRSELINQRKELHLMRDEYRQSRGAAEKQASHLKKSSLIQSREVFMRMLADAQSADTYDALQIQEQLRRLGLINATDNFLADSKVIPHNTIEYLRPIHRDFELSKRLSEHSQWPKLVRILHDISSRHEHMKVRAIDSQLLDYYLDVHQHSQMGEFMKGAETILNRERPRDRPKVVLAIESATRSGPSFFGRCYAKSAAEKVSRTRRIIGESRASTTMVATAASRKITTKDRVGFGGAGSVHNPL
jgi:hypothetical protein